jgi:hypothetical protein
MLALVSHKVLLVDADLATHGACYFFKEITDSIGLDELARREEVPIKILSGLAPAKVVIAAEAGDGTLYDFDFLASSTRFRDESRPIELADIRGLLQAIRF